LKEVDQMDITAIDAANHAANRAASTAADSVRRRAVALVAGIALSVLFVQHSAARRAQQRQPE
jgi:hypothetical protein